MIPQRSPLLAALLVASGLLAAPSLRAGDPVPDVDVILEQIPGGMIAVFGAGLLGDEILFSLPADWVATAGLVEVPQGWEMEVGTVKKQTVVRLVACATDSAAGAGVAAMKAGNAGNAPTTRPVGPVKEVMQQQIRDLRRGSSCPGRESASSPSSSRLRMKITFGKNLNNAAADASKGLAIETYRGGELLASTSDYLPPLLEPIAMAGSLSGLVELPPVVSPGETVQARILDAARLPPGGQWTLSGTVLDEAPPQPAPDESGTVTISQLSKARHDVAMTAIRNIKSMAAPKTERPGPGGKERPAGKPDQPDPEAPPSSVDFMVFELETPSDLADQGLHLFAAAAAQSKPPCGRPSPKKELKLTDVSTGELLTAAVSECAPPEGINELPVDAELFAIGAVGSELTSELRGEIAYLLAARAANSVVSSCGPTTFESSPAQRAPRARRTERGLELTLPEWLPTDRPLALRYEDKWGRTLIEVSEVEGVDVVEPLPPDAGPRITGGSRFGFPGKTACVCGDFPTETAQAGVLFDEAPAQLAASSSRALRIYLPDDLAPGERIARGTTEAGFTERDQCTITLLSIAGHLDQEQLFSGGSTAMRLHIIGTDEPLTLRLTNRSPAVVRLEGGDEQVATSSGGEENLIIRTVQAVSRGAFDIAWTLDSDCPCAEGE
jgi:hypothetical protein